MRFLSFFVLRLAAFLLIVVTCTVGREDITKLGALVHRAQSVGSLGKVRTLCFSKTDILTGMRASEETANSQVGNEGLVEDRDSPDPW
jgi:magnesium-transporting ATPase (P-type)